MASLNVYVPANLKRQMEALPDLNWSNIAQGAFRATVFQEEATGLDADAIAARLRTTRGASSAAYQEGLKEGQSWAARVADLGDLEVLATADLEGVLATSDSAHAAASALARGLGTDEDASFFFGLDGEPPGASQPSPITSARLRGFVAGAVEIYGQVRSKV